MEILDVAIGLFFGYLVLSLAVTAANEMSAAWFRRRAWMLRKGVANLLDDETLAAKFYDHPIVRSLYSRPGPIARLPFIGRLIGRGPSYIPSRTFAVALLDVLQREPAAESSRVEQVVALLRKEAEGDPHALKAHVETWFNDAMERVSGWYKRRTQALLLIWATVVTVGTNSDTLVIANALWRDPALRAALVQRAEQYVAEQAPAAAPAVTLATDQAPPPPPLPPDQQAEVDFQAASARYDAALADLSELQLPIGWKPPTSAVDDDATSLRLVAGTATDDWPGAIWESGSASRWALAAREHFIGWVLTILAVSLGAPFWFDTLNRIISIRSAGKAPEEAQKAPRQVPRPREPGEEPAPSRE